VKGGECIALSDITLIEIAALRKEGQHRVDGGLEAIFKKLETNPIFRIRPIAIPIAVDASSLSILRDPAD
jgi:hypothetical protein